MLVVVVDRPEDAERFVDGHREEGETRRARIMSEGRPAYHLPLAGALVGLAAGDLLLGLNPELLRAPSGGAPPLVAAAAGAARSLCRSFSCRARGDASRAGAVWSAGLLAAFGAFVEFQREALHDFVPSGARRVLVATAVAAFLSAAVLAARAMRGGPPPGRSRSRSRSSSSCPPSSRRAPERPSPGAVTGAAARAAAEPSRRRVRGRVLGPPHRLRLGGRDAGRRAAPARGSGRTARRARSVRPRRALDDGRDGQAAPEARRGFVASLEDARWERSGSSPFCPARPCRGARARRRTRRRRAAA